MEKETKTYYACYRGCVYLYTPFEAANDDEAAEFQNNLPSSPDPDMELIMPYNEFDFEPDECVEPEQTIYNLGVNPPSKALAKQVLKAAHEQGANRIEAHKQSQITQLNKQIDAANQQLLIATKGITDQIETLRTQLANLKDN